MAQIVFEIKSCKECPNLKMGKLETTDGFDSMQDWWCTVNTINTPSRLIQPAVEWHEERKIEIPDWCPIKLK